MSGRPANDTVLDLALAALGAHAGELTLREATTRSVEVRDGAVETVTSRGERGLGVRVLVSGRPGSASTSDLSGEGVAACVARAVELARVAEPDPDLSFADAPLEAVELALDDATLGALPVDDLARAAHLVEEAARAADGRVVGFRKTACTTATVTTHLATTHGVRASFRESEASVGTSVLAREGTDQQMGYGAQAVRRFAALDPREVGRRAALLAAGKLGARPFATQRIAVVLDPWQGMALLGALGALFSADAVLKGRSLYGGRIGERVASDHVTIVDDGRLAGGLRSAPFDAEGTPTRRVTLVERGILRGYLTDRRTAHRLGTASGGSSRRAGVAAPPRIAPSCFSLAAGTIPAAAVAASAERALRITSLLNLHTIDPTSGEFSLGATAEVLERGVSTHAVRGITIAGNLTTLLSGISAVGDDLTWGPGGMASPTLLCDGISVGGA